MAIGILIMVVVILITAYVFGEEKPQCESPIEWRLYRALKNRGYNVKTQYRCGNYRIDLALPSYRIAIECDGKQFHSSPEQKSYDKRRTSYLRRKGWNHVLRFSGSEINKNPYKCVKIIEGKIRNGQP